MATTNVHNDNNDTGDDAGDTTIQTGLKFSSILATQSTATVEYQNVNFWDPSSLKKAIKCIPGKGRIHPTPPYLTSVANVQEWRQKSQEEQIEEWVEFKSLSPDERCICDDLIQGEKPSNPYMYTKRNRNTAGAATRSSVQSGQRSLNPVGRPRGSRSSSTRVTTANPSSNNPPAIVSPSSVIANEVSTTVNRQKRRSASSRPSTIQQTNDSTVQKAFLSLQQAFAKYVEASTLENKNKEYEQDDNPIIGSTLITFSRVKPTSTTGAKPKKRTGGAIMEKAEVHVQASSHNVLKHASILLKASHEHVNHKKTTNGADGFKFVYPEQDIDKPTHMSNEAKRKKTSWEDSRKGPTNSVVDSDGTNSDEMMDL